mgnify:CR=1 FL=1
MKKIILSVFCCFICISSAFSQIDTLSIEGISCNNDTGYIKLGLSQNVVIIEADEWQYQPYDSTNWIEIIDIVKLFSKIFLTMAMAAIGLSTNLKDIKSMGYKPFIVGFIAMLTVGIVCIITIESYLRFFI